MSDPITVVSVRVEDANPKLFIFGSVQAPCDLCRAPVWVAPTSQALKRDQLLCTRCAFEEMQKHDDIVPVIAPGAVQEMLQNLKRNQGDA